GRDSRDDTVGARMLLHDRLDAFACGCDKGDTSAATRKFANEGESETRRAACDRDAKTAKRILRNSLWEGRDVCYGWNCHRPAPSLFLKNFLYLIESLAPALDFVKRVL